MRDQTFLLEVRRFAEFMDIGLAEIHASAGRFRRWVATTIARLGESRAGKEYCREKKRAPDLYDLHFVAGWLSPGMPPTVARYRAAGLQFAPRG
jgi:hypothetical protein